LEPAQLVRDPVDKQEALPPFFVRDFLGGFVIAALDQLACRRNPDAAKNAFRLADVDLFRRKINVSTQVLELRLRRAQGRGRIGDRELGAADIERIEKRLVMKERRVIDVERDFADHGERVLAVFEIVDPHVLRDEASHGIEREPLDRRFDAALVQFVGNAIAPFLAEAALRQIPAGPAEDENERDYREAQHAAGLGMANLRAATIALWRA